MTLPTTHANPFFRAISTRLTLALLLAGGVLFNPAHAGPLTPPVGPVAATGKTTQEIFDKIAGAAEPRIAINATNTPGTATASFRITQPGSYYLTANITGVVGKTGIEIASNGVTIDLNGFDLVGTPGMGAFDGVYVNGPSLRGISVINGTVRNWGDDGVDLGTAIASTCRVDGVLAIGNAGTGISVGNGCTISNCAAGNNTGPGFSTSNCCTLLNCSAYLNGAVGFAIGFSNSLSNCSAYSNSSSGFTTGSSCTLTGCSALGNSAIGIASSTSCSLLGCIGSANGTVGISVSTGSSVVDCIARTNNLDGILCGSSCIIRGNACSTNGLSGDGACIHATGVDTRIEGNNCTGADRGIDVDSAGNFIIRNTCANNTTDWDIAANNVVGPILDRRAPASAVISGFSAPSSLGSTDPNANFSF